MKISESWLREYVDPNVSLEVLCEQLTNAGLEVDGVEPVAPDFSQVVVGEIRAREWWRGFKANSHHDLH